MMSFKIKEQENVFDDHFLDIIGNEFKFDHVKGLAEWMKNSADAYTRQGFTDEDQYIYLRFKVPNKEESGSFECLDFVGMGREDIDAAFKRWGDPRAASRGTGRRVLGGHGNGGKFYMRQMFKRSQFITYRNGKMNVFGFNERKRYGYADSFEDRQMPVPEALKFAALDSIEIPKKIRDHWVKSGVGFTVVIGETPEKLRSWTQVSEIVKRLKVHPQSRRLVKHKEVFFTKGDGNLQQLLPDEIPPRKGFEGPFEIELPQKIEFEGEKFEFKTNKFKRAYLTLCTSQEPFGRMGERSSLNSVDILGEVGCIGSYRMNELGYIRYSPQAEFVYGECFCPIMEDPDDDCVRNDRDKLVDTEKTKALLSWIKDQVDSLCAKIAEQERVERTKSDLKQSSVLNELLNRWKNKFMGKVFAEVLGGPGQGDSFGGGGGGGDRGLGRIPGINSSTRKMEGGEKGTDGGGSGAQPKRGSRFPVVLLSSQDPDPLSPEVPGSLDLDPRHPAVHQRPEDVAHGIYWINTSRPLAKRIVEQYKAHSSRWRDYLFQRYVDIIVKEALYEKAKREPTLTAESVDELITDLVKRIHDAASEDLEQFLFEEAFGGQPMAAIGAKKN